MTTRSQYMAYRSIGGIVDHQCNQFFDMLKAKGLIDPTADFKEQWGVFCDENIGMEAEVFDQISKISYYTDKYGEEKQNRDTKAKNAFQHFVETEKPIIENDPDYAFFSEKQILSKLKELWRNLDSYDKSTYEDRVSKEIFYKEYIDYANSHKIDSSIEKNNVEGKENSDHFPGVKIDAEKEEVKNPESENPPEPRKKSAPKKKSQGKICEIRKIGITPGMQYQKNKKEMFRIPLSENKEDEENTIQDVFKNIEKNTLKVLHNIMKNALGAKAVSKYKKEEAVRFVSEHIEFL